VKGFLRWRDYSVLRRLILPIAVLVILTPFLLWWLLREPSPIATIQVSSSYGLAFSPDGRVLAIKDGEEILLWNSQTRAIDRMLDSGTGGTLVFSPDGKVLASVDYIGHIRMHDVATWHLRKLEDDKNKTINLYQASAGDTDPTNTFVKAAFSPDSRQLATCHGHRLPSGTHEGEIRIWDVTSGELLKTIENQPGTLEVSYSPDGTLLATGNDGGEIRLWDTKTWCLQDALWKVTRSPPVRPFALMAFTPDSGFISIGQGWTLGIGSCDLESKTMVQHINFPSYVFVQSMAFSPDGQTVAVSLEDKSTLFNQSKPWEVRLFNWGTGKQIGTLPPSSGYISQLAFSQGRFLAVGAATGEGFVVKIWDVNDIIK
jgi:WD40 repeat protein